MTLVFISIPLMLLAIAIAIATVPIMIAMGREAAEKRQRTWTPQLQEEPLTDLPRAA